MTNADEPIYLNKSLSGGLVSNGLTKREYFAARNLQGLLASWGQHDVTDYNELASDAVMAADALINALNQTK